LTNSGIGISDGSKDKENNQYGKVEEAAWTRYFL
jgi:hypothetical protein